MSPLTPKQKQILDFISKFSERKGYAPSQQEIARHFGFKSLGTVQNYLVRLEREGSLQKTWNGKRSLTVVSSLTPAIHSHTPEPSPGQPPGSSPRLSPRLSHMPSPMVHHGTVPSTPPSSASMGGLSGTLELPLLGYVAAGRPIEAVERPDTLAVPTHMLGRGEHFVLQVQGDSMIEDGILSGDYVVIRKQSRADNGQTVVALINNEATIKRFYQQRDMVELKAANPNYASIYVKSSELERGFRIEGVFVGLIRLAHGFGV